MTEIIELITKGIELSSLHMELGIIGFIQTVAVLVIGRMFHRDSQAHKKAIERSEKRAELRAEENYHALQIMSINMRLGIATALAIQEGKGNGNITTALSEAHNAKVLFDSFVKERAAKYIAGNCE